MNAYVMHQLASDRSRQLMAEAARARLARQGQATRHAQRTDSRETRGAPQRAPGLRGHLALLFGRSSATRSPEVR